MTTRPKRSASPDLASQIIAVLQGDDGAGAHTTKELVELTGIPLPRLRTGLAQLIAAGKAEVAWSSRLVLNGTMQKVPAYKFKSGPPEPRKK
jgi:hypothetical protein